MPKAKQPVTKNLVKNRLAIVELALTKLDSDYKEATYRHNSLVGRCIETAREELEAAFESLFEDELDASFDLAGIAWLHVDFGRQVFDAEAIEHILGESDYLELSEIAIPWESKAKQIIAQLEQEIMALRVDIAAVNGNRTVT